MKALLWITLAFLAGSYICLPLADPDLWWHITIGRWIVAHGEVPRVDHWNMFAIGRPWRAYSWSNEIVLAIVERQFGARGLLALQLSLAVAMTVVFQGVLGSVARDRFVGATLGVYAAVACFNHFTLRPQVIVWMLYAASLAVADRLSIAGPSRSRYFWIFLLGAAWANSHLTAALGFVAVFLWIVQPHHSRCEWRIAARSSLAFFGGTLVTPYFGGEWLTFFTKGAHPLKFNVIAEFQPATILQYSTIFMILLIVLIVVGAFTSRKVPSLARCVLGGGMALAGLTAVKFLPFAVITLCALFAVWWRAAAVATDPDTEKDHLVVGLRLARDRIVSLAPRTHGAIAFFFGCVSVLNISRLTGDPIDLDVVPKKAVDFFVEKKLPHPILNEFGAGGYLMYRFSESDGSLAHPVSIDGRTNVNPSAVWEMHQAALQGKADWRRYLEAVQPNTILWRQGSPFVSLLFATGAWCRVFASGSRDHDFTLFIKRDEYLRRRPELTSTNCEDAPVPQAARAAVQ